MVELNEGKTRRKRNKNDQYGIGRTKQLVVYTAKASVTNYQGGGMLRFQNTVLVQGQMILYNTRAA